MNSEDEMRTFVAVALLLLLPAVASAIDEILTVTGPGREAPVMEDSDKIPVWDLTMEHRWRGIPQGMSSAFLISSVKDLP